MQPVDFSMWQHGLEPMVARNTTALIPIEEIGAAEGVDWRAGPVKGATMCLKKKLL